MYTYEEYISTKQKLKISVRIINLSFSGQKVVFWWIKFDGSYHMTMNHMTMNHSLWSTIHSKYLKSVFTKLKIFLNGPLIPRYDPFKTLYDVRFLIFLIPWSFPDYVFPDFGLEVLFYPFYQVYKCMDIFNLGKVVEFWCTLNIFLNDSSEQIR